MDGFAEAPVEVIEGGDGVFVEGAGFHVVDAVDAVATFADPAGLGGVVFLGVGHGFWVVDFFVLVSAVVSLGGLEGVVDGFEGEVEHKGGVFFAAAVALEPGEGLVGEAVGEVAFGFLVGAVDVEGLVEVGALALERDPVVEAFSRLVVVVSHVPFADHGGAVAGGLEVFGVEAGAIGDGALVIDDAVVVHVLAGEDGGAGGGAEGGGDESVLHVGAFFGHAVEVGGFEEVGGVGVAGEEIVAVVVGEDDDDVWLFSQEASGR